MSDFEQDLMNARNFVHKATKDSVVTINRVKEDNIKLNKNKKALYSAIRWPQRYPMNDDQKEKLRKQILFDLEKQIKKFTELNNSLDTVLEFSGRTSVFRSLFFKTEEAIINIAQGMKFHITRLGKLFASEGNYLMEKDYEGFKKEFDEERVEYKKIFQLTKGTRAEGADITAIIRKNAKLAVSQEMKAKREADPISDLARKGAILGASVGFVILLGSIAGSSSEFSMDSVTAAKMVDSLIGGIVSTILTVFAGAAVGGTTGSVAGIIKEYWTTVINPRVQR